MRFPGEALAKKNGDRPYSLVVPSASPDDEETDDAQKAKHQHANAEWPPKSKSPHPRNYN
jgi:hypothetical protein